MSNPIVSAVAATVKENARLTKTVQRLEARLAKLTGDTPAKPARQAKAEKPARKAAKPVRQAKAEKPVRKAARPAADDFLI